MLVTMAKPIFSHVKDKNSIFTPHDEDTIFLVKGKIVVFHQYLIKQDKLQIIYLLTVYLKKAKGDDV